VEKPVRAGKSRAPTNIQRSRPLGKTFRKSTSVDQGSVNLNAWTQLGYLAGALAGGDCADTAGTWCQHPLWTPLVAPHWPEFLSILGSVPHARVRVNRADIDLAADALAELLSRWFMTLGFELVDDENGGFAFYLLQDGAVQQLMRQAHSQLVGLSTALPPARERA